MGEVKSDLSKASPGAIVRGFDLTPAYSENVAAKIIQVAQRGLLQSAPLTSYPHTVPQDGPEAGKYEEREADFWTCGFFPGCIYALLERSMLFPQSLSVPSQIRPQIQSQLLRLGRHYGVAINQMSSRTDTHDMGFIVQPALQKDWELTGNKESLQAVTNAAYALASRYDPKVKAIRSWDVAINDRYSITDMNENFLVIIDSMCNLDLLYYIGHTHSDPTLLTIATNHALSIIHQILRPDHSSYHLVNFSPVTGQPLSKMTNQGYADSSTWSRGQAWAILGFAQVYTWTKELLFLETAVGCARYFLARVEEGRGRWEGGMVPVWDFDAPVDAEDGGGKGEDGGPLRDVSAGVITANGLFIIHQALQALPSSTAARISQGTDFLDVALSIVSDTLAFSYDMDLASFEAPPTSAAKTGVVNGHGNGVVNGTHATDVPINIKQSTFEAILRNSTTNWNPDAHKKYKDHGLVYADYYLLEFGNKLLRAGLL
ncbi:glycoside hydrolase family 88 protein [Plenodomus tracheiphilus IPT5]|uniref:Glycoside hydrolase family 88 protein n=1 Tax=Plenodomus tracheiphilus IPT5 TaxID=1408161 RepID=A0A6A7BFC3_9PLEO|nr:glycoside hydrolase family 88 protein [Plenodomus tracheiphilus IPT5]